MIEATLYDMETGKGLLSFPSTPSVKEISFSKDEQSILVWYWGDTSAYLLDKKTGDSVREFQHKEFVNTAAISKNGTFLLLWGYEGASIWNVETGKQIQTLPHDFTIHKLAISSDGKYVMTTNGYLYDINKGTKLHIIPDEFSTREVVFSPDSQYVLTASDVTKLWDVKSGVLIKTFQHPERIHSIAFSSNGQYVLTGSWHGKENGKTIIWDINNGRQINTIEYKSWPESMQLLDTHGLIGILVQDTPIRIYNFANSELLKEFPYGGTTACFDFSTDGQQMITGGKDGTIRLWDIRDLNQSTSSIFKYSNYR